MYNCSTSILACCKESANKGVCTTNVQQAPIVLQASLLVAIVQTRVFAQQMFNKRPLFNKHPCLLQRKCKQGCLHNKSKCKQGCLHNKSKCKQGCLHNKSKCKQGCLISIVLYRLLDNSNTVFPIHFNA